MLKTITSFLLLCIVTSSYAQMPVLVKDINVGPGDIGSADIYKCVDGNKLYFAADDSVHGKELWITDGTAAGTHMVMDVVPGTTGSSPFPITPFNGKMLFAAVTHPLYYSLWSTDGTAAGTALVKDVSVSPFSMGLLNGKLYFLGIDSATYPMQNLWVTDGTTAGTKLVKEFNSMGNGSPLVFKEYNGRLYFTVIGQQNEMKIWSTDGTDTGTRILENTTGNLTVKGGYTDFIVYKNRLWFCGDDYTHGAEVWSTDGTDTGTHMLKDIAYGSLNCFAKGMTIYHNELCFYGYGGLFRTDGTDTGTHLFSNVGSSPSSLTNFSFTAYNDRLYFCGLDSNGYELWVTNATDTGTYMVKDIWPGYYNSSNPSKMIAFNGLLYFEAMGYTNSQIWTTNGTTAGTQKLWPPFADSNGQVIGDFAICNNMLFFDADYENAVGTELYRIGGPTSVAPAQLPNESVTVYPNPVKDVFTVRFSQSAKATVKLLNMNGVLLKNETVNGLTKDIDLACFPPGIYLLDITSENGHVVKRVAKL